MIYFNQLKGDSFFIDNDNGARKVGRYKLFSLSHLKSAILFGDKMSTPYKHQCSICNVVFFSKIRSHHICSKKCRSTAGKSKKPKTSCEVCGWHLSLDLHHEKGKEYILCPNHHALLTRGIYNIEELFNGNEIVNKKTMEDQEKRDFFLRLKYQEELKRQKQEDCNNQLYNQILKLDLKKFTYKDLFNLTNYSLSVIKERISEYVKIGIVERIGRSNEQYNSGKFQPSVFQLRKDT